MFIPTFIHALEVPSSGEFYVTFSIPINTDENTGLVIFIYDLEFDDNVFEVTKIETPNFESKYVTVDGEKGILSIATPSNTNDSCFEGSAFCGKEYKSTIYFNVKSNQTGSYQVKTTECAIGIITINDLGEIEEYYDEEELNLSIDVEIQEEVNTSHTNQVLKPSLLTPEEKDKVLEENKPTTETNKQETPVDNRSSNTNLSKLEIYNYPIEFNKDKKEYEITISKEVNKLDIRASVEDEKSIYIIHGNDDLKANDYKVEIEVTAENNTKSTYTIKVNLKEETEMPTVEEEKKQINTNIKLDKKIIKLIGGIGIGISLILLIIIIKSIRKKKALNKLFNDL